ncbi:MULTISPECIES: hypothetical protein [unclassified Rhizobium]|uniref:hypothetical protein n=1 Tax=unclassified Rhizobium TaxID=2613769 RepID=UPI000EA83CF8|nr:MULTISPECIES: hypothetical protein [unclassified Rhizobium]AYG69260.1 hypothetical protein CCGE531_24810 [Rhizobium sp. CCGE531]AYG75639.1 hypothetical protein CCGE532_24315 [Rhizobium sp. CCGE532]
MTPTELLDLLSRTHPTKPVEEHVELVIVMARLDDAALRAEWLALRADVPGFLESVTIRRDGTDIALDDGDVPASSTVFAITLNKVSQKTILRLFYGKSLAGLARALDSSLVVCVAELTAEQAFTSHGARFQPWTEQSPAPFDRMPELPNPRSICHDASNAGLVPADIRPWLLQDYPRQSSQTFEAWRLLAAPRLMAALSDQVYGAAPNVIYQLSGPPSRKVGISLPELVAMFERLNDGVFWVFAGGERDTETRHVLLAAEWARSYRQGNLAEFGDGSLESAKAAYAAYVKAGSKETLKALADLRKTVVDEAQKATQRAQDMTGALWKDLAVATTPFVIKILSDAAKTPNTWIAGLFAVGAAAFLILSFRVQTFINAGYFAGQDRARAIWTLRLNQVLSATEIEEFSETPIRSSVSNYDRVRKIVRNVYGVLVAALIIFAGYQFYTAATTKVPPTNGGVAGKQGQSQTSPASGSLQPGSAATNGPATAIPQNSAPATGTPATKPP